MATPPIVGSRFDSTTAHDLFHVGRLRKIFDDTIHDVPTFASELYKTHKTDKYEEIDRQMAGLEDAQELAEGQDIPLYSPTLGNERTYTIRKFGIGFRMTDLMKRTNKRGLWERWTKDMARRQKEAKDAEAHVLFNNLTSTSLTAGVGFDTLAVASASHTGLDSGTAGDYSNYLNSGLSLSALESARYYFKTKKDAMGNLRPVTSKLTLVVEPTLFPDALEYTQTDKKPGTANNDLNVIRKFGIEAMENPRLSSTTNWFVIAKEDERYDFNLFTLMEPDMVVEKAPDRTRDWQAHSLQYFSYGYGYPGLCYVGKL